MQIGQFLLRRLREVGLRQIFGVPGDYNLEFMQQLEEAGDPAWIGCCNELNASYAADGYARVHGLSALMVTYGVGALSAVNGLAGAYCEHVPVICISGSLPLSSLDRDLFMHHTLADHEAPGFMRIFAEVTVAQARLSASNAVAEIDRLILAAWRNKRPVYLELPSDLAYIDIKVPDEPLQLTPTPSSPERLQACVKAIAERLQKAERPAILLDLDASRFDCMPEIVRLAEALHLPVASMSTCKGAFDETAPHFAGNYAGAASKPKTRETIEGSDCLLAIGVRRVDSTSGFFTDHLPDSAIHLRAFSADVSGTNYQAVALKEVLAQLSQEATPRQEGGAGTPTTEQPPAAEKPAPTGKLNQVAFWATMQKFLREGDVVIAEDGTSSSGAGSFTLSPRSTFVTQAIWGSIGYTLGSLLGTLFAAPDRRHLLFIGDGSFQLTAQELSTMLRHGLKPWIFLINNGGYTIERTIMGREARYNDVANWNYAELPEVFCREPRAVSHVVTTVEELRAVLDQEYDGLVFVEARMEPEDAPAGLIKGGHASANLDFGPRGPQQNPDLLIPIKN